MASPSRALLLCVRHLPGAQGDPPPLAQGMALGAEGTWDFTTQAALLRVFSEQVRPACLHPDAHSSCLRIRPWQASACARDLFITQGECSSTAVPTEAS